MILPQIRLLLFIAVLTNVLSTLVAQTFSSDVGGEFVQNNGHVVYTSIYLVALAVLLLLLLKMGTKLQLFILPYILLLLWLATTSVWSAFPLRSGGLAVLFAYNIVLGSVFCKICSVYTAEFALKQFLFFWAVFVFVEFVLETVIASGLPSLDEIALISALLSVLLFGCKSYYLAAVFFLVFTVGQSLSAIIAFTMFSLVFLTMRDPKRAVLLSGAGLLAVCGVVALVGKGVITVYGKDLSLLVSGSGRFNAWATVLDEFLRRDVFGLVFGGGFGADRYVLAQANLTWTVDVHNNLLQLLSTGGLVALVLFLFASYIALAIPINSRYVPLRFAVFLALFFFGLTSSYFFARPSFSAEFWLMLIGVVVLPSGKTAKTC